MSNAIVDDAARSAGRVVGLDLDHDSVRAAEHWLLDLVHRLGAPAGLVACTHLVYAPHPHAAVSLSSPVGQKGALLSAQTPSGAPSWWPNEAEHTHGARTAAAEHAARRAGRAVHYPGVDLLTGSLTVGEVIERSAIERVVVLGDADAAPDTVLHTRDYVRPEWQDGRLTLVTQPGPQSSLVPFEFKNPTPCCADH